MWSSLFSHSTHLIPTLFFAMIPPPAEIIYHILDALPRSDLGARTLSRCAMTGNCLLREVALDEDLWQEFYSARYKHSNLTQEVERRRRCVVSGTGVGSLSWRHMYAERRRIDNTALGYLKAMEKATTSGGQIGIATTIVEFRFDVWDALTDEASRSLTLRPSPSYADGDVRQLGLESESSEPLADANTNLTRIYWASELLKVIMRRNVIDTWKGFKHGTESAGNGSEASMPLLSMEDALASLSTFHGIHPDVVRRRIKLKYISGFVDLLQNRSGLC